MSDLLDDFLKACDRSYFIYDTLADAQQAAHWLLKGHAQTQHVLIVGDVDVPDDVWATHGGERTFVIRARDLMADKWLLVTRS
jgi:hypothetical protein